MALKLLTLALLLSLSGCLSPGGDKSSSTLEGPAHEQLGNGIDVPSGNGSSYAGGTMIVRPLSIVEVVSKEFEMALGQVLKLSPLLGYEVSDLPGVFDDAGDNFTLAFVIEAHRQLDTRAKSNSIIEKWDDYATGYPFACRYHNRTGNQEGVVSCHTHYKNGQETQTVGVTTQTSIADGKYHSIVYQREGSQFRLYYDGALVDSKEMAFGDVRNNAVFRLGHRLATSSYPFYGRIASIRLYLQPVSGESIAAQGVSDAQSIAAQENN